MSRKLLEPHCGAMVETQNDTVLLPSPRQLQPCPGLPGVGLAAESDLFEEGSRAGVLLVGADHEAGEGLEGGEVIGIDLEGGLVLLEGVGRPVRQSLARISHSCRFAPHLAQDARP